jgi:rhodanese-related sulfurtransferase
MSALNVPIEMDPNEYKRWREAPADHPHMLLDIRETWENERSRIEGSVLIPMGEVPVRIGEIPLDEDVIVYCHHGVRSFQVAYLLRQQGYTRARSLSGGIARWSQEIDQTVPQY